MKMKCFKVLACSSRPRHRLLAVLVACGLLVPPLGAAPAAAAADNAPAPRVILAGGGQARMPVIVGEQADPRTRTAAVTLTNYLFRISGAVFAIETGDGADGIVVGRPDDFTALPFETRFPEGPFAREHYRLTTMPGGGLWLIGATGVAVEHAVWDLLYRLGHRQFFPGATWEIVPRIDELSVAVQASEAPDYFARRIWYNWGVLDYNRQPYAEWCARNRAIKGFDLNSGHAYGGIVNANQKTFNEHPEYLALVDGERKRGGDAKFCVANPGLRALVLDHARRQIERQPATDSLSMDPSDGGGWCECEPCLKLGSPSDRALTLANEVAQTVNSLGLGPKYVGMYAYNMHGAPPAIPVHSNVIISATTSFIRGGLTLDAIIDGWQKQGATLGIYDYFSVIAWDWNRPRAARAARPEALARDIRKFHGQGVRFFDAESGDAWGPYGLGYYIAARVMWDVDEAGRVAELVDDFLTRAFGPAREPMAAFYTLITADTARRSDVDLVGRMYRHLDQARALAADRPDVLRRLEDLLLYTRYVELYNTYASAVGDAKTQARDAVLQHSFRMRRTMMVHTHGIWARLVGQKALLSTPDHPAKSDAPFTVAEFAAMLSAGIAANQPVEIAVDAVTYSDDLIPAALPLGLAARDDGAYPAAPQDSQTYYLWVEKAPADIRLRVTVKRVWDLRPHQMRLYSPLEVRIEPVAVCETVKANGLPHDVVLHTPYPGLHRLEIVDGGDHTRIEWPAGMPVVLPSSMDTPRVKNHFRGAWTLYFYVPRGTRTVAGWASRIANWAPRISGTLVDGAGNVQKDFGTADDGWFQVVVPEGQDGRIWSFRDTQGERLLASVPPYFARSPDALLLPREVVEADAPVVRR